MTNQIMEGRQRTWRNENNLGISARERDVETPRIYYNYTVEMSFSSRFSRVVWTYNVARRPIATSSSWRKTWTFIISSVVKYEPASRHGTISRELVLGDRKMMSLALPKAIHQTWKSHVRVLFFIYVQNREGLHNGRIKGILKQDLKAQRFYAAEPL